LRRPGSSPWRGRAIVDGRLEVVQFRGRTGPFLEPPHGRPQANLLAMAREGLAGPLGQALEEARARRSTVRAEGVRVRQEGRIATVNLRVVPLPDLEGREPGYHLVLFEDASAPASGPAPVAEPGDRDRENVALRHELSGTRQYLQTLVESPQETSDELGAANEELTATNEELQSTNEELQSAKEELQATNEELTTVNDELRHRNQELDQVASDLINVLESVGIPLVIVDAARKVRRFTPTARDFLNLIPSDVNRPLDDLKLNIAVPDLDARLGRVLATGAAGDWEVQDGAGRWHRMQIHPYRSSAGRVDGAIVSLIDIDALKHAVGEAERARDFVAAVLETASVPLLVLDAELRVVSANHAFEEAYGPAAAEVPFLAHGAGAWDTPEVRGLLAAVARTDGGVAPVEIERDLPGHGRKSVLITAASIVWYGGSSAILLGLEDVTERRRLERERALLLESEQAARVEAERANAAKDLFLATLSHELRSPLSVVLLQAQLLERLDDERVKRGGRSIARAVRLQQGLIGDLLDVSRIAAGKLLLDVHPLDLGHVVRDAVEGIGGAAAARSIRLETELTDEVLPVSGDAARLQQVVTNLLTNAVKFTPTGGRVSVQLARAADAAVVTVSDSGSGIKPDFLPHLFETFSQADASAARKHGGLGLGLAIVRHLVEMHGGTVRAESPGEGGGATFTVTVPLLLGGGDAVLPARGRAAATVAGLRVLVVDDDDDTRDALTEMLTGFGAEVRAVSSAAEGLRAVQEDPPQVLLCDLAMPGEDGFSLIAKIRALPAERGGRVPAVALTALAGEHERRRALLAGFDRHLANPIEVTRLTVAVSELAARGAG
jgi:two-component system CheB/CheR fusion protein